MNNELLLGCIDSLKENLEKLTSLTKLLDEKESLEAREFLNKWIHALDKLIYVEKVEKLNDNFFDFKGYDIQGIGSYFSTLKSDLKPRISDNPYTNKMELPRTRLATPEEVERAIKSECERRGIKDGATVKCLNTSTTHKLVNEEHWMTGTIIEDNEYWMVHEDGITGVCVFKNGEFATVIEEDKFADLKEAHKNGAVIQYKTKWFWIDDLAPDWIGDVENYRIKPEEKPKVGDVCKFWQRDEDSFCIGYLSSYDGENCLYDCDGATMSFENARTLTKQEVINSLFPNEK